MAQLVAPEGLHEVVNGASRKAPEDLLSVAV